MYTCDAFRNQSTVQAISYKLFCIRQGEEEKYYVYLR